MSSSFTSRKSGASPLGAGLSEESRKALNSAFDALSNWRNDISSAADRNSTMVFDRMASAAKAMGWPAEFVDMTRQQMQSASKMQLQVMDQIMDVWEQQMKNPGAPISMSSLPSGFPGLGGGSGSPFGNMPGIPGFDMSALSGNPMQFWMQAAEMWQKSWMQAMSAWMDAVQSGRWTGGR
jgi:hypothetical protein